MFIYLLCSLHLYISLSIYIYFLFVVSGSPPSLCIYLSHSLCISLSFSISLTLFFCLSCSFDPPLQLSWLFSPSMFFFFFFLSLSLSLFLSLSFCSYHSKRARNVNVLNTGEMLIKLIMLIPRCSKMCFISGKC